MDKEQEIIKKARDLFMKYGLRSITMDDLAHEIGISKKTLYLHFKDKADLILKIIKLEIERIVENMETFFNENENVIDRMIKINKYLIEMRKKTPATVKRDLEKYYPDISKELMKLTEEKMFIAIKENHLQGQKDGLIRSDLNIDIISALQVCRSSIVDNIINMLKVYEYEKVLTEIFDYHIRAIATEKGLKYYLENLKNK